MTERTVETEVKEIVEETVTYCNSCGNPDENADPVFVGNPAQVYDQGVQDAITTINSEMRDLVHRQERLSTPGKPDHVTLTNTTLRKDTVRAEEVSRTLKKGIRNAEKRGFKPAEETGYHLCDTCKRGLEDTDQALPAATAGNMAEEADQKEVRYRDSIEAPKFIKRPGNWWAAGVIVMIMAIVFAPMIPIAGPVFVAGMLMAALGSTIAITMDY